MNASQKNNKEGTLLTYREIAEDANISVGMARKLAKESGSIIRISDRLVRIDKNKFYDYLRGKYAESND